MKKFQFGSFSRKALSLSFVLTMLAQAGVAQAVTKMRDVPRSHWAKSSVQEVIDSSVMQGDPNGNFRGYAQVTRYELAVALANVLEKYDSELHQDREDLASLVQIMEQFQNELRIIESRVAQVDDQLVAIGAVEHSSLDDEAVEQIANTQFELESIKADIDKLKNKGFFFDTIIKGTFNDVKKVVRPVGKIGGGDKSHRDEDLAVIESKDEIEEVVKEVHEDVHAEIDMHESQHDDFSAEAAEIEALERELYGEPLYEEEEVIEVEHHLDHGHDAHGHGGHDDHGHGGHDDHGHETHDDHGQGHHQGTLHDAGDNHVTAQEMDDFYDSYNGYEEDGDVIHEIDAVLSEI